MLEFNASVFGGEVPVGFGVMGISVVLPGGDFIDAGLFIGNPAVETLGGQDAEFGFGEIEPAACHSGARRFVEHRDMGLYAVISAEP